MRTKNYLLAVVVGLVLALWALPIAAAPLSQGAGGVRFGPYTLQAGDTLSEDLVVFGGPVLLRRESVLRGDLTVFGPVTIEQAARLEGQLVAMGTLDLAGTVDGDVFAAGTVLLRETARVRGDVASVGMIDRRDGAIVEGEITPMEGQQFRWTAPIVRVPEPIQLSPLRFSPFRLWARVFETMVRAVFGVVVMAGLALVIVSLWPEQTERAGRAVEEAPLTSYGVGLLGLVATLIVALVLTLTICLSPFAAAGLVVVGVGVLFGWVALSFAVGRRVLIGVFSQEAPKPVTSALVGIVLVSGVVMMARIFGPLYALLLVLLVPPAAGAVVLTRFGTVPYATQGRPPAVPRAGMGQVPTPPGPPSPAVVDAPRPGEPPETPSPEAEN